MLSREHVIHRSAGEDRRERQRARQRRVAGRSGGEPLPVAWAKLVMLVVAAALFAAFLVLNRGAVVEPRLHLVFTSYQRPSLLVVMLLTSFFSAAVALMLRATFGAVGRLRRARAGKARLASDGESTAGEGLVLSGAASSQ
jgi:hypothetical protein